VNITSHKSQLSYS